MEPLRGSYNRHNQQQLLRSLVEEARNVRRGILSGQIGGKYFEGLTNPPVSHFAVNPSMEKLLSALELNYITKYHEMRDKSAKDVSVYAFFYGLCEAERIPWGYPRGRRDDRSYFVQRCFSFNAAIQQFLAKNQTIRCDDCGACLGMDKREMVETYKWRCPECIEGTCTIVSLGDDFKREVELSTRKPCSHQWNWKSRIAERGGCPNKSGEIATLVDVTYQLVGHRTSKLHEMGLVHKTSKENVNRSTITDKARQRYLG